MHNDKKYPQTMQEKKRQQYSIEEYKCTRKFHISLAESPLPSSKEDTDVA